MCKSVQAARTRFPVICYVVIEICTLKRALHNPAFFGKNNIFIRLMLPCRFGLKKSKDTIVLIPVVDSRFLFRTHLNRFQYNKITVLQTEQQSSSGEKNSK